jgi:hypothetical protein
VIIDKPVLKRLRAIEASIRSSSPSDRFYPLGLCEVLSPSFSADTVADLFGLEPGRLEGLVNGIFGRRWAGTFEGVPPRSELAVKVRLEGFDPGFVRSPIDWRSSLHDEYGWRLHFSGLAWLPELARGDPADHEAAGRAVLDFRDHLLRCLPIDLGWDRFTWNDHALAIRANAMLGFLIAYLNRPRLANPEVVLAALQILLVQLAGCLDDACYSKGHNHGLFQDIALLRALDRLTGICHREAIRDFVLDRIVVHQLGRSVSPEGAHVENSPEYHLLFAKLLYRALSIPYAAEDPPAELRDGLEAILGSLFPLVRPDAILAPFGDSTRGPIDRSLGDLRKGLVESGLWPADSRLVRNLDYILSRGAEGTPPEARDTVHPSVGYASFRSDWRMDAMAGGGDAPVCLHVKCGSLTRIHKHEDDSSFQLYGLGQELVVDPAKFANDRSIRASLNSHAFASHSVFRIVEKNGQPWDEDLPFRPGIEAWSLDRDPWVLCRRRGGWARLWRLFVYRRPADVVIVDLVASRERVAGQSQLLLHPSLDRIEALAGSTGFRAVRADGHGLLARSLPVLGLSAEGNWEGGLAFTEAPYHAKARRREMTRMALFRGTGRKGRNALAVHLRVDDGTHAAPPIPDVRWDGEALVLSFGDGDPVRVPFAWG